MKMNSLSPKAWLALCFISLVACVTPPPRFAKTSELNTTFDKIGPIIAFRSLRESPTEEVVSGSPNLPFTPLITFTKQFSPALNVFTYAAVDWLHDDGYLWLWRVNRNDPHQGMVEVYNGHSEHQCQDRRLGNTVFAQESQPVLTQISNTVYAWPGDGMSVRTQTNLITCAFEAFDDIAQPQSFPIIWQEYLVTYCPAKQLWAMGATLFELRPPKGTQLMGTIGPYKAAAFSPDCSRLLAYDAHGWYVFTFGQWDTPIQVLEKDLSQAIALVPSWTDGESALVISRPSWSPDGNYFVYSTYYRYGPEGDWPGRGTSYIVDIAHKREHILIEDAVYPTWKKPN